MSIDEEKVASSIQRYEGTPRKRGRRGEQKRFQGFRAWLKSWFHRGDDLAAEYAAAKVKEAEAEAEIKQQQAAEIAARTDVLRNSNTKTFFDLIDSGVALNDPNLAQDMKLAKLLQDHPEVMDQVAKIRAMREKLAANYGVKIEIVDEGPRQLSDHSESTFESDDTGQE
jgi:hypothetical protein